MKSLKNLLLLTALVLIGSQNMMAQNAKEKIVGKWKTEDNTIVEVFKNSPNNYIIKQISAGKTEDKKYDSKVFGKDISGTNNDYNGIVIDPDNNKEYKAKWTLSTDVTKLTLNVKWGFISFKETWTKIN